MTVDESTIQNRCTGTVFERGQKYREEGRIRQIDRFDDTVTGAVQGSNRYDVTVELRDSGIDARCTCPYDGAADCKHVVAVLLAIADEQPADESERVEAVLENVSSDGLRAFVGDALARNPELRDRFLARFGDTSKSVEEYRTEVDQLFNQHTKDYPVVTEAIDFSQFFDISEQYRERDRYLAAATVYRALFESIDDNMVRIDAAYDHYARAVQSALDGYADCVLATDPDPEEFEQYAGVLDKRASTGAPTNRDQFIRALDDLEDRR